MQYYLLDIKTDKNLGEENFLKNFLKTWYNDLDIKLKPEFFSIGEPVNKSIYERGIEAAINTWIEEEMAIMLRRKTDPKFTVTFKWRPEKGLDQRIFPWGCSVWFAKKAKSDLPIHLFKFLIEFMEPAFGYITEWNEWKNKHRITYETKIGIVEESLGDSILPNSHLPGVYWLTYFGKWAIDFIGAEKFKKLENYEVKSLENGLLVKSYENCFQAETSEAIKAEKEIISILGKEKFFDISKVDIEKLRQEHEKNSPSEEEIQELIEKKKTAVTS